MSRTKRASTPHRVYTIEYNKMDLYTTPGGHAGVMHFQQTFTVSEPTFQSIYTSFDTLHMVWPETADRQLDPLDPSLDVITPEMFDHDCEAIIAVQFHGGEGTGRILFMDQGGEIEAWVHQEILPVLQQEDPQATGGYACGDEITRTHGDVN